MTTIQTEFEFTLPKGYVDGHGHVHKNGVMRLATIADEISAAQDERVLSNQSYLPIILLSFVVKRIGEISNVTPEVIESLFISDFAYLRLFYDKINKDDLKIEAICPSCGSKFDVSLARQTPYG